MFKISKRTFVKHTNKFAKPWAPQPKPKRPTLTAESRGIRSLWVRRSGFIGQDPWYGKKHRKLTRVWTGPWMITTFRSPIVVELKDIASSRKQIVHVDRIVPCLDQETETEIEVVEQTSQSPIQSVPNTQPTPSYLAEHQTSTESQDVDSQSSYGRVIRRPMRYR